MQNISSLTQNKFSCINSAMTKTQALKLFGGNTKLAKALGKTPGAVSQWSDDMPQNRVNEIVGCAVRQGLKVPGEFLK